MLFQSLLHQSIPLFPSLCNLFKESLLCGTRFFAMLVILIMLFDQLSNGKVSLRLQLVLSLVLDLLTSRVL